MTQTGLFATHSHRGKYD